MCQNGDNAGFCANNNGHGPVAISMYLKFLIQVAFNFTSNVTSIKLLQFSVKS